MDKHTLREAFDLLAQIEQRPSDLEAAFVIADALAGRMAYARDLEDRLDELNEALAASQHELEQMSWTLEATKAQRDLYARNPPPGAFAVLGSIVRPETQWVEAAPEPVDFVVDAAGQATDVRDVRRMALGLL